MWKLKFQQIVVDLLQEEVVNAGCSTGISGTATGLHSFSMCSVKKLTKPTLKDATKVLKAAVVMVRSGIGLQEVGEGSWNHPIMVHLQVKIYSLKNAF